VLDFLHVISFARFPVFQGTPTEHSVTFLLMARLLEGAGTLVAVTARLTRKPWGVNPALKAALASVAVAAVMIYAAMGADGWLPRLCRPTVGILEIGQELFMVAALCMVFACSVLFDDTARRELGRGMSIALLLLFGTKAAYVLMTCFGPGPGSLNNFVAHILKAGSYVALAGMIISVGVLHPHQRLRDTRQREHSLRAAVQEHADTLTAVIGASLDYLVIQDLHGRFLVVSPSVARLFERPVASFTHATWVDLGLPPAPMRAFDHLRAGVIHSGTAIMQEGRLRVRDRTIDLEYQIAPILDAQGAIQAVVTVARDITDRKTADRQLLASLEENQILLAEVHHRVKNNLQVVSSILQMQAWTATNSAVRHQFEDAVGRILALAKVHELLYQQNMFSRIDFERYVQSLCGELSELTGTQRRHIQLVVDIEPLQLSVDRAAPLALIVHELVTNSLKHAFDERGGTVTIRFRFLPDQMGELSVHDNGTGIAPDMLADSPSLGMTMLRMLARQLRGTLTWDNQNGTYARLRLPLSAATVAAFASQRATRQELVSAETA